MHFSVWCMLLACAAIAHGQKTYPSINSDSYAAAKFALGLPPATSSISTVEGNSTVLIQSYFEVQGVPQVGVSGLNRGFVEAYGTSFTVNGKPYFCGGTNAYYAGLKWIMSDNEVAVMMKVHSNRGANVLRVFAHSNFNSVPSPMMPLIGVYNEDAIERLDLMLVAAAQNGIRIIMVLGNYWSFLGGIQEWVDQGIGPGNDAELFYTNPTLRSAYKDWIKHLITRNNTLTGQRYIDDPTILAWELLNEPRAADNYEKNQGLVPGKMVCDWVWDVAAYIKSLDSNHMVTTGEEGFRSDGNTSEPYSWINNGYEGVDFTCNLRSPSIDFATVHAYPDSWGMSPPDGPNGYAWLGPNFFADRAKVAQGLNKPIILEEYGMRAQGYLPSRDILFQYEQDQVNAMEYACTLVWAVAHYSTDPNTAGQLFGSDDGQGYVFGYDGDGSDTLLQQYAYMQSLNALLPRDPQPPPSPLACDDIPPDSQYTCPQQAGWGKCGESWMQGNICRKSCGRC